MPCQHQIGKAKQRKELRRILGQAAVTGLAMAKEILHDMEGVLDFGPNAGLGVLNPFNQMPLRGVFQLFSFARAHGNVPRHRALETLSSRWVRFKLMWSCGFTEGILPVIVPAMVGAIEA